MEKMMLSKYGNEYAEEGADWGWSEAVDHAYRSGFAFFIRGRGLECVATPSEALDAVNNDPDSVIVAKASEGDKVCSGKRGSADYDEGTILETLDSGDCLVAWQSGIRTTSNMIDLRPGHEGAWPLQLEEY